MRIIIAGDVEVLWLCLWIGTRWRHASRRRLVDRVSPFTQTKWLFGCSVTLIYEDEQVSTSVNSHIAERTEFWWNERKPDEPVLWQSKIRLGAAFFQEVIQHPVPLDMNTLKALKRCALGLDLYLWLVYRTFALTRPVSAAGYQREPESVNLSAGLGQPQVSVNRSTSSW